MSSQEDFLASQHPLPGDKKAQKMTAGSGLNCLELYNLSNQHGASLKMFVASLVSMEAWSSSNVFLTWKVLDTTSRRLLFQLVPSTLRIGEIESGLLPTPNSQAGPSVRSQTKRENGIQEHIQTQLYHYGMLPTLRACTAMSAQITQNTANAKFPNIETVLARALYGAKTLEKLRTTSQCPIYLNPLFAEVVMGYPKDFTLLETQ